MTDAQSPDDAVKAVLAADRPTAQRLALLESLSVELRGERAVLTLLAAAQAEKTLELRRAFFQHAAASDVTRISDRQAFIQGVLYFATLEDDAALRRTALARLPAWSGYDSVLEDVLVETLLNDLDRETQHVCVAGLNECATRRPENVRKLLDYIVRSPAELREALIELLGRFDAPAAQAGLITLLNPAESEETHSAVLTELGQLPRLEPPTVDALRAYVINEPNAGLQAQAVAILRDSKQADPELFAAIFELFARYPDRSELLEELKHRLASFPDLAEKLGSLFLTLRSAQTRVKILKLLEPVNALALFLRALHDPHWQVRRAAVNCCARHQTRHAVEIERALVDTARSESVIAVREAIAGLFTARNRREPEVDRELLAWIEREQSPRVERALAAALSTIPPSGE